MSSSISSFTWEQYPASPVPLFVYKSNNYSQFNPPNPRELRSKQILDELLSVLARKFARNREELARVAVFLSNLGEIVEPAESLTVLADEPDNRIVECALAANAQLIVTGDRAMLALGEYQGIRIISLSAYLG